ncbi:MAG: c-type cytochrome domain-containing protein [Isosphaeraceae bacterium]
MPRIPRSRRPCAGLAALAVLAAVFGPAARGEDDTRRRTFFETKVRPVLAAHCYSCHGAAKQEGGLRLDWRDAVLKGGDSGPAVEPGRPDESLVVQAVAHAEPGMEMPKNAKRLSPEVVENLRAWVRDGAFDPRDRPPTVDESAATEWEAKLAERAGWWSLEASLKTPARPTSTTRTGRP